MAVQSPQRIFSWLPRILMLLAIWGIAVFLWGTFGAWTRAQYLHNEERAGEANAAAISAWLKDNVAPLERLASDPRLAAGMDLPAGVESLPIQRVLYEYAYLTGKSEVYIADLGRRKIGRTAGAGGLPPEVISRIADMPASERMILGFGQRNGQLLLIHKVTAPMPYNLVVMVPVSLSAMAASQPLARLPEGRELSIIVPHTAGWGLWRSGTSGFEMDSELDSEIRQGSHLYIKDPWMTVLTPLQGWPDVLLGVHSPNKVDGTRLLPQLLVALWALMMSAAVLWKGAEAYRAKVLNAAGPVLAPFGKIGSPMQVAVEKIAAQMKAKWISANKEIPLVDGPGAFDQRDFVSSAELAQRVNAGQRRPRGAGALKLAQNATAAAPAKVERRSRPRGKDAAERAVPNMQWPEKIPFEKREKKSDIPAPKIDQEDMRAVVEDCLKKKRIKLLYQPIYSAGDNMPVMHEVYARLVRVNGDIIPPDQFLPVAIRHRMALDLDIAVLRRVVHEHFSGNASPMTPLALNISSTSLDGIAYLQEMANQGPRVLQKIGFEVRSQEMIRDPKALKLLKDLQKHGGNLAVDYFGGGIAMLDASKAMGFNYVKLNAMRLMGTDSGKKELIMLSQHARSIGLPIILEMVGDDEALKFARRVGAEFLQGYALMRPQDTLSTTPLPPTL